MSRDKCSYGNYVDVCRAVRRAVRRDDRAAIDRIGGYAADYRTFLILVLCVSRDLELHIGLRAEFRAELLQSFE